MYRYIAMAGVGFTGRHSGPHENSLVPARRPQLHRSRTPLELVDQSENTGNKKICWNKRNVIDTRVEMLMAMEMNEQMKAIS